MKYPKDLILIYIIKTFIHVTSLAPTVVKHKGKQ